MSIEYIFFDFDGVFTDNFVYTSTDGTESVKTSRSDSFALSQWKLNPRTKNIKIFIISSETDKVVEQRAAKLGISSFTGVESKDHLIEEIFLKDGNSPADFNKAWQRSIFVGNDLNDLSAMKKAKISFCPADANSDIKNIASRVFEKRGGEGFVREVLEYLESHNLDEKILNV
jgi:YrbI family 3-deoxy-D-manno-octulosonate 8-phosphate phosphatase